MTPGKRKILAGAVMVLCANQAALAASPAPTVAPAPAPLTFAVGDTLQISFYEPFDNDAKWQALGRVREPGPSFYRHDEISGDYTVAPDWTISVPVIGNVVVAHHTAAEIEAILGKDFTKAVGGPGFVNVSIAERKPLYVIGWVSKPGVYGFEPDMTPLDLVALAGGYRTTSPPDIMSGIEAVQETAKQIAALDQLSHALAHYSVLKAEINNTKAEPTQQLIDLVGETSAESLVREEQARRMALVRVRAAQLEALQIAVDAAENALVIDQGRLQPTKDAIGVHLARLSSLSTLSHEGLVAQLQLDEGQDSVSDYQDRQQNVLSAIAEDQHQLALARVEIAKFVADTEVDLNQQLDECQSDIDDLTPTVTAGAEVIRLLALQNAPDDSSAMRFSIVRGGQLIAADVTTGLQPGDVLQVDMAGSEATNLVAPGTGLHPATPPFQPSAW